MGDGRWKIRTRSRTRAFFPICILQSSISTRIVGQLHDVVEAIQATANVQDVELTFVRAGNRLEALDAGQFALEGTIIVKRAAVNDFHGTINTKGATREPDFAIAAFANAADQRVIRDWSRRLLARLIRGGFGGVPRRFDVREWGGIRHGKSLRAGCFAVRRGQAVRRPAGVRCGWRGATGAGTRRDWHAGSRGSDAKADARASGRETSGAGVEGTNSSRFWIWGFGLL